jgi:hypothetical protein
MATNTQTVTGFIVKPNGDPFTSGTIRFTLGEVDTDGNEVISQSNKVEFSIASDGAVTADLWPNTRGSTGSVYLVQVREAADGALETIGRIQVPDAGPYDLATLMRAFVPEAASTFFTALTEDEFNAKIALMDERVAAGLIYRDEAEESNLAAAASAAEAALYDGPKFDTIALMAAYTPLVDDAYAVVYAGFNGGSEIFQYDAASSATADGVLVVTSTGTGQWVSTRTVYSTDAEFQSDPRPDAHFTVGDTVNVGGPSGWTLVKVSADEHRKTAGGSKWQVTTSVPVINPRAFGAVGDGVTDDTKALAAMFRVFEGSRGLTFDLRGGEWMINSTADVQSFTYNNVTYPASGSLTYTNNAGVDMSAYDDMKRLVLFDLSECAIIGSGGLVKMLPAWNQKFTFDHGIFMLINCDYLTFDSLKIDGNRANLVNALSTMNNHLIYAVTDATNLTVTNCVLVNSGNDNSSTFDLRGDGMYLRSSGFLDATILYSRFENCGRWGIAVERGDDAIYRVMIAGNIFKDNVLGSIDLETRHDMYDISILGNLFEGRAAIAIGGNDSPARERTIENVIIKDNVWRREAGAATYSYGIVMSGGAQDVGLYAVFKNFVFDGNVIHRDDANNNWMLIGVLRMEGMSITNNTWIAPVKNISTRVIATSGTALSGICAINGNQMSGWGSLTQIVSLNYDTSSPEFDMIVADNSVVDAHYAGIFGFSSVAGEYTASSLTLKGNVATKLTASTSLSLAPNNVSCRTYDRHLIDGGASADIGERPDGYFLRTYADNATAVTAGLVAGDTYKTAAGEMRVVV